MPFLKINGITVKVTNASPRLDVVRKGRRGRSYSGQMRDGRRGRRRTWSMKSPCLIHSEALALTNLIWGTSHVFHFYDGLQAASGLNPVPGYSGITWQPSAGLGGDDIGYIQIAGSASSPSLSYDAQINDEYTILWHERDGGDWSGAALNDAGIGYLNGSFNSFVGGSSTDVQISIASGVVTFSNANATAIDVDQIVILPWRATASQMATWTAINDDAVWGPGPALLMSGDMFTEDCVYGYGRVNEVKRIQFASINNGAEVSFEIDEVDETYLRGVFPDCVPVPPPTPETGAFATTFAMSYGGTSGFVSFGDKADAAVPSPTLTTLNQAPYANHVQGYLVVYDETGALSWVRSINAVNAGTNPRAYFQAFKVDAANDAVYACSLARYDQELRDESGTLLNTLTNTAGTSSNNFFSCFYRFELSTGNLVWARKNDFNTAPVSGTRCRPEGVAILNGRLYFSGFQELASTDRANFATFNGADHPAANPLGSGASASTWLLEVDPATGNGIKCVCNRRDVNTSPFTSSTFIQGGGTRRAHFLVADTVNNRLHLTSNHGGNYQQNEGGVDIGVGDPATFTTRQFSSTSSSGGARGYLATYSDDLSPIAASTIFFTATISGAYNSRAMLFRPAILDDGSIVFAYQNGSAPTPTPPTVDIDRDGAGGSYGGFVLPQPGDNASTVLIRIPADHGSPTWATSFAVKTNTTSYCRETCVFPNADNTRLLVVHKAQGGGFNDPTVFNGTPSVIQDAQQGYEVVVDAATGAEIWKAANRPQGTNARAKGTGVHEFATGPAAGQIWMPRYFTHGTASQTWGAENPDTSLGYRVGLGWETSTSRGGTGPTTHNYALVMIVRNADGTVDGANCWPIMATNNLNHYSQGLETW